MRFLGFLNDHFGRIGGAPRQGCEQRDEECEREKFHLSGIVIEAENSCTARQRPGLKALEYFDQRGDRSHESRRTTFISMGGPLAP